MGDEAEIAFRALPGTVYPGRIVTVLPEMAAGEVSPQGHLVALESSPVPGRITVLIDIDPSVERASLPGGAAAAVAVYTEHWEMFAVIRRILLRMRSWTYYLDFEH